MVALSGLANFTLFICAARATVIAGVEYTNEITARSSMYSDLTLSGILSWFTLVNVYFEITNLEERYKPTDSRNL